MKRKNNHIKSFLLIAIAAVITSCSSVKYLKEKESLLIKNRIQSDNILVNKDEVVTYMRQKPNRTILGFIPLKLWIYNWVNPEKEEARDFKRERKLIEINKKREAKGKKPTTKSYFTKWLLKNGEAPAILDTSLSINTADIIKKYIISKGFFNAEVTSNIEYKKRKKAIVTYEITTHKPWLIKSITYASSDTNLLNYVLSDTSSSLIKPAMLCDFDVLDYERERIASNLQQHGFYYFNKDFISYRLDSANKDNSVTVLALIKKNTYKLSGDDNIYTENHKQYAIHNIYVYSDYPIKPIKDAPADTLVHSVLRQKKNLGDSIYFIHQILKINPSVLSYAITIKQNETYAKQSAEQTIARLTSLKVFKFVNVNFLDITKDSILNPYGRNLLDARIQLNRSPVHVLTLQGEGTNSSGNFGVAANIVYQNRNLFKGAEIFSFKLNGSMEIQQLFTATTATNNYLFNTFETSFETGLEIPRFLLPMRQERFSKSFRPTTNIQLGLNYQFRPDYNRTIARVSFGYDWKESRFKRHLLYPIEINSVKINPDSTFMAYIQNLSDNRVKYQYTNHLISALKYSFQYNNQEINKTKSFTWFTFNYEGSGNLLRISNVLLNTPKNSDNQFELFNIPYAQYLRFEFDFRRYIVINRQNQVVFRANAGIGFAYGNSPALPFEKGFYAGGSNGIRGWRNRTLGPGSYSSVSELERIGDNKLEFNIESRFPLYKIIKGAAFFDAGNIWLNKKNPDFPGGEFQLDKFLDEIAFSGGIGIRLDFDYFIIRGDLAVPLKNPALNNDKRITINSLSFKDLILNFGIGYPF